MNFNDLFQVCFAKFFLNLTFISRNLNLMQKFLILFIAKTSFATAQKKGIKIKEIWNASFITEYMNSINIELNSWILKPTNFEAKKTLDQAIYKNNIHVIYLEKNTRFHLFNKMTKFIEEKLGKKKVY